MIKYTREQLLEICDLACVPESQWGNRDTADMIAQVGAIRMFLQCGCNFVCYEDKYQKDRGKTFSIDIEYKGFDYFDHGGYTDHESCYLPHLAFIKERRDQGRDWYC